MEAATIRPVPATESGYTDHCLFTEDPSQQLFYVAALAVPLGSALTGVRFSAYTEDINWIPLGILSDYTTVGSYNDLSVDFGSCVSTTVVAATIQYFGPGDSPCGTVITGAAAGFPYPIGAQCDFSEIEISGGHMTVNGVYDMLPGMQDPDCFCPTIATEPSTWGQVKALYRN